MKIVGTLLSLPAYIAAELLHVYAFTVLWRWFLVPLGAPAVAFWTAAGIFVVLGMVGIGFGATAQAYY